MASTSNQDIQRLIYLRDVKLRKILGPMESLIMRVQSVLVWERPRISAAMLVLVNIMFWLMTNTSCRVCYVVAMTTLIIIVADTWKNKIWPEIRVPTPDSDDSEGWTPVHPRLLSVPELCHYLADFWTTFTMHSNDFWQFRRQHPGKFCLYTTSIFTLLAIIGCYISGLMMVYVTVMSLLLWPCVAYNSIFQKVYMKFEPLLMQLDYSMKIKRTRSSKSKKQDQDENKDHVETDTDSELEDFCLSADPEATAALARAITDSEDEGTSRSPSPPLLGSNDDQNDELEAFTEDLEIPSLSETGFPEFESSIEVPAITEDSMNFVSSHFKDSSDSSEEGDETIVEGLAFPDIVEATKTPDEPPQIQPILVSEVTEPTPQDTYTYSAMAGEVMSRTLTTVVAGTLTGLTKLSETVSSQAQSIARQVREETPDSVISESELEFEFVERPDPDATDE